MHIGPAFITVERHNTIFGKSGVGRGTVSKTTPLRSESAPRSGNWFGSVLVFAGVSQIAHDVLNLLTNVEKPTSICTRGGVGAGGLRP